MTLRFALAGLARAPGRTAVRVLVLAAAAALIGAMVLFVGHSLRTMTQGTVRSVQLDWQGPVPSYRSATQIAKATAADPAVASAFPVATAPFDGIVHRSAIGTIRAGAGALLAVPNDYPRTIHAFRFLRGAMRPGQVVLDQQLAATLQAQPGDTISLRPKAGAAPVSLRVSGIAIASGTDVLFQPLNPLVGPAPAQPPSNVAILPLATFVQRIAPKLPVVPASSAAAAAVPGVPAGLQWQVHAQVDPAALRGSPSHALTTATQIRNRVERTLTGRVQYVDNLADALTSASGDALYAEALYIMLAVPGALVGLGLAYLAALGAAERERRELALLRSRGASRSRLVGIAAAESLALGLLAGLLAAAAALGALRLVVPDALGLSTALVGAAVAVCVATAFAGALVARLAAGARVVGGTVVEGRRSAQRTGKPLWERLYLDIAALATSGVLYWWTSRTGFSAVVNPDSNPTLSLAAYMFLAPALLWIGAALLVIRLRGRAFGWLAGRRASSSLRFLLASAGRRGAALNRGLLLLGLLLAFGVELGLFTATYDQQARVDAQLTLGADVVVTAPPGAVAARGLERTVARVPGVTGTSAIDHSYAYVGPDLQDTFGVDPGTIAQATTLRDSYFLGGSASTMLGRLRARPDAILVSLETINDYSLHVGDLLKLRVLDRSSGRFRVAPFHVAGVVQEFPAAPRDSFMVANRSYLEQLTHDRGPNVIFARVPGNPVPVARRVAAATSSAGGSVQDLRHQAAQTVSSITTVDLSGISKIEEAFALGLAAAAMLLFVVVALAERRLELATMAALGAPLRTIGAFLWSEALIVLAAAIALAALLGWLLAEMLIAMLRHVFDPPPDHLAAPWPYLAALGLAGIAGALLAAAFSAVALRRMSLGAILREE
ncbi:MAG TPA: FtsX-like permease family protein [Gaiellaceae bacterium]|nr:FtsX-like permease family protein [Gaiellaceae bacterium]